MTKTSNRSKGKERANFTAEDIANARKTEESVILKETEGFHQTLTDDAPEELKSLVLPDPVPPIAHLILGGLLLTTGTVFLALGVNEVYGAILF
jgi:hypothetical protein